MEACIVNADRASFWFRDKKNNQYCTLAAVDNERITVVSGVGVVGKVIEKDKSYICNAPYEDPDFNPDVDRSSGYTTKSILCVPIENTDGVVIGAFEAINKLDENGNDIPFSEADVKRLSIVTAFCGKTLESQLLYNEAMLDGLTGLNNRYAVYEYYNTKVVRNAMMLPMSIIMCDLDHFKRVNDTFGHNVGDLVLKEASDLLKDNVDYDDAVVRWGGEEFVIILYGKELDEAGQFAERVRKVIESHSFSSNSGTFNITMSFGVRPIDIRKTLEENVKSADEKLYVAKNSGRNQVVM